MKGSQIDDFMLFSGVFGSTMKVLMMCTMTKFGWSTDDKHPGGGSAVPSKVGYSEKYDEETRKASEIMEAANDSFNDALRKHSEILRSYAGAVAAYEEALAEEEKEADGPTTSCNPVYAVFQRSRSYIKFGKSPRRRYNPGERSKNFIIMQPELNRQGNRLYIDGCQHEEGRWRGRRTREKPRCFATKIFVLNNKSHNTEAERDNDQVEGGSVEEEGKVEFDGCMITDLPYAAKEGKAVPERKLKFFWIKETEYEKHACARLCEHIKDITGQDKEVAEDGALDHVAKLPDGGADVNAKDAEGQTALIVAAEQNTVAQKPPDENADLNAQDADVTSQMLATQEISNTTNAKVPQPALEKGAVELPKLQAKNLDAIAEAFPKAREAGVDGAELAKQAEEVFNISKDVLESAAGDNPPNATEVAEAGLINDAGNTGAQNTVQSDPENSRY